MTTDAYLDAAEVALNLLRQPPVVAGWSQPSALPGFTIGGLAAHLAGQVTLAERVLRAEPPSEPAISLLNHYRRSPWAGAGRDSAANVAIRQLGQRHSEVGPERVSDATAAGLARLRDLLPGQPPERVVALPWTGWCLTLDDFLLTRIVELVVHSDDLAVSAKIATPQMPVAATGATIRVLTAVAEQRHGPTAVVRAFSRAERAPTSLSVF